MAPAQTRVLARYRSEGQPLPGWQGQVNRSHLAHEAKIDRTSLTGKYRSGRLICEAAAELGIADATCLRSPVHGQLDGAPWRGPIGYDDVEPLTRMLQPPATS